MRQRYRSRDRLTARIAAGLAIAAIGVLTLLPVDGGQLPLSRCLVCGERGVADAASNMLLFLPLGLALGFGMSRGRWVLVVPVLSGMIEVLQLLAISGRHASLGDLTFNTLGGAGGFLLARRITVRGLLSRRTAAIGLPASFIGLAAVLYGGSLLMQPAPTPESWYGQWTAELGGLERYGGTVLGAAAGPAALPDGLLPDRSGLEAFFGRGGTLRIRATGAAPSSALAPLFSVYDAREREILLVGVDGPDLVLRYRTRAAAWGLDGFATRIEGMAADLEPGVPLALAVTRSRGRFCFELDERSACRRVPRAAASWTLLTGSPRGERFWHGHALDALWAALLVFPLGFWSRGRMAGVLASGVILLMFVTVPIMAGAGVAGVGVLAAAVLGFTGGRVGRSRLARYGRPEGGSVISRASSATHLSILE